jgi:dTMP kinase
VHTGLKRALMRNLSVHDDGQDRFEKEKEQFHHKVREGYLVLARQNKKRFKVIDATRSVDEMALDISDHMMPFINKNRSSPI